MFRNPILGLVALPLVTLLSTTKTSIGPRSLQGGIASLVNPIPVSAHEEDEAPLAKADRLQAGDFDNSLPRGAVDALRKAFSKASEKLQRNDDEIVSWHWHEGSKIVRSRRSQ